MSQDSRASDSIVDFADGDEQAAMLLRHHLARLRDMLAQPDSPVADRSAAAALRSDIGDVLAGRRTMRALAGNADFVAVATSGMREARAAWLELPPDAREAQVRADEGSGAPLGR